MGRARAVFRCDHCGVEQHQWSGQCAACGEWNTLTEEVAAPRSPAAVATEWSPPVSITEADLGSATAVATGLAEVDRVLDGGLVPGSVTLLGGEPGIGKSTLLLQLGATLARAGSRVLYVAAEESIAQVRARAERLGALDDSLAVSSAVPVPEVLAQADSFRPDLLIVDSVQAVRDPRLGSAAGGVGQVRECVGVLADAAKAAGRTTVLVGHVTKDGSLAGPKVVEHLVDSVLVFEGDRHHDLRLLRLVKHRFGSTAELGVFQMTPSGLIALDDPSGHFLADRQTEVAGSAVVPIVEGRRPMLVEVQALVASTRAQVPVRSSQGVEPSRLPMLQAVLERRTGLSFVGQDIFCSVTGGARVREPAVDLGLALAMVSSRVDLPLPHDLVVVGEVGLAGELRQVPHLSRRLGEAARIGYRRAIVPASAVEADGVLPLPAATITEAARLAGLLGTVSRAA